MEIALLIIGILIILAMALYALRLFSQLKQQKNAFVKARLLRVERLKESILIIAKAMQAGECNHSEGVIRLKMLLEPLGLNLASYPGMQTLYVMVMDMPTHDKRKALKVNERMRLDLVREKAEFENQQKIAEELPQLIELISNYSEK